MTGRHPTEGEVDAIVASYKRQLARYRLKPAAAAKVMKASAAVAAT